jgi:hypothetical protein
MIRPVIGIWLLTVTASVFAADYVAPRGPDGVHPDLNGIWQALNEANYDLERHIARSALQTRPGPELPVPAKEVLALGAIGAVPPGLGVVKEGRIPYTPEALAIKQDNQKHFLERSPEAKCFLPGIPRANYMPHPFQILQNKNDIFMTYQYAGAVRDIFMEDPGEAPVDSWMGQSYGKWQGDTLVVEVTAQMPGSWFDRSGNHHSDQMKVTERFTPMSDNHLLYEATIDDPETFTKPWTISMPLYRRMEANAQIMEFKCVRFVEELMYGEWRRTPIDELELEGEK